VEDAATHAPGFKSKNVLRDILEEGILPSSQGCYTLGKDFDIVAKDNDLHLRCLASNKFFARRFCKCKGLHAFGRTKPEIQQTLDGHFMKYRITSRGIPDDEPCAVCGSIEPVNCSDMLACDICKKAYCMACCDPPISQEEFEAMAQNDYWVCHSQDCRELEAAIQDKAFQTAASLFEKKLVKYITKDEAADIKVRTPCMHAAHTYTYSLTSLHIHALGLTTSLFTLPLWTPMDPHAEASDRAGADGRTQPHGDGAPQEEAG
jgi:hypothetical protein